MITLSPDQFAAIARIRQWARSPSYDLTFGGLAGTGKTSLLRILADEMPHARVMAPTGRAAQVLRRKGVRCETIHSTIYNYTGTVENERGEEVATFRDKDGILLPPIWVCDEASMVSADVCYDVRKHGVPVLWVGDHGQLPPVGGDPGLMREPDIRLERIHRQAEGSEILTLAHSVRAGASFHAQSGHHVTVAPRPSIHALVARLLRDEVDQVACAFNATRRTINMHWRMALGRRSRIDVGERLVVLFNDRTRGVYNGTILRVLAVTAETAHGWALEVEDDGGEKKSFNVWNQALGAQPWRSEDKPSDHVVVDYGYCLTVHKSQGGQWSRFALVDEPCRNWDMARWRYTGVTRAADRLWVYTA